MKNDIPAECVPLKNFLEIPYDELEVLNLEAADAAEKLPPAELEKKILRLPAEGKTP